MKRLIHAIITFCLVLVSCGRQNDAFVLNGTLQNSTSDSILVCGLDSRFDRIDTIRFENGQFSWSFNPDTVTTLILTLSDGRQFPAFAEKGVQARMTIPSDTGEFVLEGGACNDAFYSFYKDVVKDTTLKMVTERIDSFIIRDPFSEVTPYLLYEYMIRRNHADASDINALIKKMSGNMQDAPFLISLQSELANGRQKNDYLTSMSLRDTVGQSTAFSKIGTTSTYVLCCLWGTWNLDRGHEARLAMKEIPKKFADRSLIVLDLSIDVNIDRWKREISKDTLGWKSYIDTDGWDSKAVRASGISDTPIYLLFSGARRILFQTTSIERMERELDNVLPKPKPKETKPKETQPKKLKLKLK